MKNRQTKYIFVTGGVVSSLGKGLTCASLAAVLESRGLKVTICKVDPYLNVDPGTMSPFQHGEVFVTEDGAETDLDLGHYERFLSSRMQRINNFTAGQVYESVIKAERRGDYLGGTVQVIPHVTDEIKARIIRAGKGSDICIAEVGGTVGDIEGLPFLEAIRQFRADIGSQNVLYIHLTLVPFIAVAGELKTKPTQHSVKELTSQGIQPDIIVLRSEMELDEKAKEKIALFCNVSSDCVITAPDVKSIYELPIVLHEQGLDSRIAEKLNIWTGAPNLEPWKRVVQRAMFPTGGCVKIAMVGKYVDLKESYKSLHEAVVHGAVAHDCRVELNYVDSEKLEQELEASGSLSESLLNSDAVLVLPGFGSRGSEGKIRAVQWARENNVPFFGICLGLQMAVVDFARNILGIVDAASEEFVPDSANPVIHIMAQQKSVSQKGGTMRLGSYPCVLKPNSLAHKLYGKLEIPERHRHRFEVNNSYREQLEAKGMVLSGVSPDGNLVEILEYPAHPWFLAVQFHPEFQSKPLNPHPLFSGFVAAAKKFCEARSGSGGRDVGGGTAVGGNGRDLGRSTSSQVSSSETRSGRLATA